MSSSIAISSFKLATRAAPLISSRAIRPAASILNHHRSSFTTSSKMAQQGTSSGLPIAVLNVGPLTFTCQGHVSNIPQQDIVHKLPSQSPMLFAQKKAKNLSFETIAKALGRDEVAVAALFYGQARANDDDIQNLSKLLDIPEENLRATEIAGWPDRGRSMECPPKEPLVYRLWEIVQNYGYAYKAILNEKFGDGIMSAITFSTKVEKETDEKGDWVKITLRGKW